MKYRTLCLTPMRPAVSDRDAFCAFKILLLAACVGMFAGYACHGATHVSSLDTEEALTLPKFVAGVVARSADLNYITEQDSEVFAFYRNTRATATTESVFLALLRRPAGTQIFRQPWAPFFQIRTQYDPTGRWGRLQTYLEAHLTQLTIFRIPRDPPHDAQYDLYAIGLFNGETVVGVQMFGVAT